MATKHPDSAPRLGGVLISNQVVAELLEQLRNGIWQDTDHLPPELELANRLNVSRTVVRDALSELERAGYIERVRGIGTVINRDVVNLGSLWCAGGSWSCAVGCAPSRGWRSCVSPPTVRSFPSWPPPCERPAWTG